MKIRVKIRVSVNIISITDYRDKERLLTKGKNKDKKKERLLTII